ncbi:hypothetical protein [Candidatus Nitrosocosmicus arcticus]|uniref:Uncharacterized protein n=1 Tax=Candidatus Nitrosocosmicus arcticus TaxID=2035267 RepID=A0A557SWS6_9ARCH|nr:hypothetical protein [Candidatus Nitrosocosmicus arcticus]TVP41054.1 hypothetical protein NARC_40013 [Candidatus Nitrosocosmicus arcticus]
MYNEDGSLDIYSQHDNPPTGHEPNWLGALADDDSHSKTIQSTGVGPIR